MLNLFSQTNYKNYITTLLLSFFILSFVTVASANDHIEQESDPKYLIEEQVKSAKKIDSYKLETIATAYILFKTNKISKQNT